MYLFGINGLRGKKIVETVQFSSLQELRNTESWEYILARMVFIVVCW